MKSRTYVIGGKEVVIIDRNILDIVEKTENLEIGPAEATEQLRKYLLSDHSGLVSEYFGRIGLWEAITIEFDNSCRGRIDSLHEMYAKKHDLSGKLII